MSVIYTHPSFFPCTLFSISFSTHTIPTSQVIFTLCPFTLCPPLYSSLLLLHFLCSSVGKVKRDDSAVILMKIQMRFFLIQHAQKSEHNLNFNLSCILLLKKKGLSANIKMEMQGQLHNKCSCPLQHNPVIPQHTVNKNPKQCKCEHSLGFLFLVSYILHQLPAAPILLLLLLQNFMKCHVVTSTRLCAAVHSTELKQTVVSSCSILRMSNWNIDRTSIICEVKQQSEYSIFSLGRVTNRAEDRITITTKKVELTNINANLLMLIMYCEIMLSTVNVRKLSES